MARSKLDRGYVGSTRGRGNRGSVGADAGDADGQAREEASVPEAVQGFEQEGRRDSQLPGGEATSFPSEPQIGT